MNIKRVAFHTLGCKVNQYETDAMIDSFIEFGYKIVNFDEISDVYIINTCTVTSMSDKKSRQMIRRAKVMNPDSIVVAVGCYAQVSEEEVKKIEGVNLVLGNISKSEIVKKVSKLLPDDKISEVSNIFEQFEYEEMKIYSTDGNTRAYIKIQDGCNQFCSYCIIPFARGRVRSRNPKDIYDEAIRLASNGYKEIVLTGINISSYGSDLGNTDLVSLIQILETISPIKRIRLGSIEQSIIDERFADLLVKSTKLCNQFHLSLQSGSNSVLQRMNRKYTAIEYISKVLLLKSVDPLVSITTDIIVGFPNETDDEFKETLEFVKAVEFSQVHLFKYSQRKGTVAFKMQGQIDEKVKTKRLKELEIVCEKSKIDYLNKFVGKEIEVLFEKSNNEKHQIGHTMNFLPVKVITNENLKNQVLKVKIEKLDNDYLYGKVVSNNGMYIL
jgi:threonylcarbamoyladenosine tRNA methylthiotransferase MtaB